MDLQAVLEHLENAGTAQNRKIYRRHGAGENLYGVSFADLGALAKQIKKDQTLAEALWRTGNHDARMLATMIADPKTISTDTLRGWAGDLDNYVLTDALSSLAAATPFAMELMRAWTPSEDEWAGRAGWMLLAQIAMRQADLADAFFLDYLAQIEAQIHSRKNRVRDAMNSALIAIGIRNTALKQAAVQSAERIGVVRVDHGETGCKTPDACGYIEKTWQRKAAKAK